MSTIRLGLIFLLVFVFSCGEKKDATPMVNTGSAEALKHKALVEGDTVAYNELSLDYMDSPYEGFLYTALLMANKYEYSLAYIDVYYCLTDLKNKRENTELDGLDERTRKLALEYLSEGAKRGNKECIQILGNHYILGKYLPKDQEKGAKLIKSVE